MDKKFISSNGLSLTVSAIKTYVDNAFASKSIETDLSNLASDYQNTVSPNAAAAKAFVDNLAGTSFVDATVVSGSTPFNHTRTSTSVTLIGHTNSVESDGSLGTIPSISNWVNLWSLPLASSTAAGIINATQFNLLDALAKGSASTIGAFTKKLYEDCNADSSKYLPLSGKEVDEKIAMTSLTYAELVSLRDGAQLVPGHQYRITDYACTTTQENTQSAGHVFDIIVVADDVNVLNEKARAIQHEGDTYFASANLAVWQIWYDLNNDASKYLWADAENGKGVIYRMIDEWNNDCPYDFKNIQFKRWMVESTQDNTADLDGTYVGIVESTQDNTADLDGTYVGIVGADQLGLSIPDEKDFVWVYTMSGVDGDPTTQTDKWDSPMIDASLNAGTIDPEGKNIAEGKYHYKPQCESNKIGEYKIAVLIDGVEQNIVLSLNDNVLYSHKQYVIYQEEPVDSLSNVDNGNGIPESEYNYTYANVFGASCACNTISGGSNTFGNFCDSNTFGDSCGSNTFGNGCGSNTFGDSCGSNTFGNFCDSNTFGNGCGSNTFGDSCYFNTFGNSCDFNTFGNFCYSNTFGNSCGSNTFGNDCYSNTFGNSCYFNTFGNDCDSNTFGQRVNNTKTPIDYVKYVEICDGVQYVNLKSTTTPTSSKYLQNISVHRGVKGKYNSYLSIDVDVLNQDYEIVYTKDTNGNLKKVTA